MAYFFHTPAGINKQSGICEYPSCNNKFNNIKMKSLEN